MGSSPQSNIIPKAAGLSTRLATSIFQSKHLSDYLHLLLQYTNLKLLPTRVLRRCTFSIHPVTRFTHLSLCHSRT